MPRLYGKGGQAAMDECHGYKVMDRLVVSTLLLLDVRQSFATRKVTEEKPWYHATK
jgi:hypothetical protein